MRPEYYADLYRQYQTYVRNYSGNTVFKIACGPNAADYSWTEVLMREAAPYMYGLGLHYSTRPLEESWDVKGPATGFDEHAWFSTLSHCLRMEELIRKHSVIMDHYDPDRRVALVIQEPERVKPTAFKRVQFNGEKVTAILPPMSVCVLSIEVRS